MLWTPNRKIFLTCPKKKNETFEENIESTYLKVLTRKSVSTDLIITKKEEKKEKQNL